MNVSKLTSQYKDLPEFLSKHNIKSNNIIINENLNSNFNDNNTNNANNTNNTNDINDVNIKNDKKYTHTRIPDKSLNIYPGCYLIPREEMDVFYQLYYQHVFVNKNKEYLTEKQLESGGPLAIDFDFRYSWETTERQHNKQHIIDMFALCFDILKELFIFHEQMPFPIYIFEKPNVNRLEDGTLTKDGIHVLIGIKSDLIIQSILRDKLIEKLPEYWDLPLINDYESVIDSGISRGTTNWQCYGSRKPGNECYELTYHFIINYDANDGEFTVDELPVENFNLIENLEKLSVTYENHQKFELNPKIIDIYTKLKSNKSKKAKLTSKTKFNLIKINDGINDYDYEDNDVITLDKIISQEILVKSINNIMKNLKENEYELRELHEYTQALPARFYEPGTHNANRQVAFALKHTDERLFLSWVMLRSKASDFVYSTIPQLYCEWKKFSRSNKNNEIVTKRSIIYWVKKENYDAYEKIKKTTIDYYIDRALETCTEYDLAVILKEMYKENYVCVSYDKRGIWYRFKNHHWVMDKGLSLREKISKDLYNLFTKKSEQLENEVVEYKDDDQRSEFLKKRIKLICDVKIMLKKTNHKDHIMREAAEVFYDGDFIKLIDTNKYLMCFNNGVIDFETKKFREGYPEDYITKSTKINYIPYDDNINNEDYNKQKNEIIEFMNKLFPIPDLYEYMWEHLASCLIGVNKNQTFNVYHGSGSNGKSILADLMSLTLGEYKGTVPITLVTETRNKIGGTSDEVLKLKGVRYAVMQEPSKGVKLNEGIMKELTGGDPLQARGLYLESEIFEPQFTLVVCTNNLFDIESNDDGTWRRIRKCDFPSKFVDEGEVYNDETKWIFTKDKSLKDKLPRLAPIFASLLVKKCFETDGIVKDCETVMNASRGYRKNQDFISAFILEMLEKTDNIDDKIGKKGLMEEFKLWFQQEQGAKKIPKGEELYEAMNKRFGECTKKGWYKVRFIQNKDDDNEFTNEE